MYKCDKHGYFETDWCDQCEILLKCDCSTTETQRFKDLNYGDSYWTTTIYIIFCPVCGEKHDVSF
jgi:hypothetical protein